MSNELNIREIEDLVETFLAPVEGYFLVEIKNPTDKIKIFVDADQGVSVDVLGSLNKKLRKEIEERWLPEGNFDLEVSSPGLDEPLKIKRQFKKNVGRTLELILKSGMKRKGVLKEVKEDSILLESGKKKKKKKEVINPEDLISEIPFEKIKTTKVSVLFK